MPIVQLDERPGLDLGWGHPRPDLLPTEAWVRATSRSLLSYGWQALTYGHPAGPAPLIDWLCERSGDLTPDQVFVTAGASHALALIAEVMTRPGDVALVDSPSYHLAFPILADRGLTLVRAPSDELGLDPARLPLPPHDPARLPLPPHDPARFPSRAHDPAARTSAGRNAAAQASADRDHAGPTSADRHLAARTSADRDPAGQTSADRDPAGQASADRDPAAQTSKDRDPAGQTSADLDPVPASRPGLDHGRRGQSGRAPLLYLVPTFANPTGRSLPDDRRRALADLARRGAVTVIEDDTYRDLAYSSPAPESLWQLAGGRGVIRIGSFAKTVAPGLRLGWISADPEVVDRLTRLGYVHSGGGVNHSTAMAMACFGRDGDYDQHLARVRTAYREQRDALVGALRELGLPVEAPAGGWFVWLPLPAGVSATRLLPVAEELGVSFVPGPVFSVDGAGGDDRIRLSFSRLPGPDLAAAAGRLARAVRRLTGR